MKDFVKDCQLNFGGFAKRKIDQIKDSKSTVKERISMPEHVITAHILSKLTTHDGLHMSFSHGKQYLKDFKRQYAKQICASNYIQKNDI